MAIPDVGHHRHQLLPTLHVLFVSWVVPPLVCLCASMHVLVDVTRIWLVAVLPVIPQFSLSETQKIIQSILNFSICTGTTG